MKTLTRTLVLAFGVSAFGLAGCQSTGSTAEANEGAAISRVSNTTCPMSGEPIDGSAEMVSYQGKEIGFCCKKCVSKFEKMSDADKAATMAKMGK